MGRGVNSSQNLRGTNHTTADGGGGGVVMKFSWAHRPSVLFLPCIACVTQAAVYQGSLNQMLLLSSGKVRERSEQNFFINPSL